MDLAPPGGRAPTDSWTATPPITVTRRDPLPGLLHEYERESNARLIDRIVLKPNPGGPGGKKRGPETRVDVYLTGSDKPYRPTYAKLSKEDEEALRRHSESLRQARAWLRPISD